MSYTDVERDTKGRHRVQQSGSDPDIDRRVLKVSVMSVRRQSIGLCTVAGCESESDRCTQ